MTYNDYVSRINIKHVRISRIIILLFFFVAISSSVVAQNQLTVVVKNIELIQGTLMLQLYKDSTLFPNGHPQKEFIKEKKVDSSKAVFVFDNLPDGNYAMAIFQDINGDRLLNTKKFGIPAEPFAFSNNALGKFGPPHFIQAQFILDGASNHQQEMSLIYRKPKKTRNN